MPIDSAKPLKLCKFCNKEVQNLATHIINMHPSIIDKLEEGETTVREIPQIQQRQISPPSDISAMIREKLDLMLNIKIIEMLSTQKDVSLQEISKAIQPPTSLQEIKTYHDMMYGNKGGLDINVESSGSNVSDWIEIAKLGLPIIAQMLPKKQEEMKNVTEHRRTEERSTGILKPIQGEITGDTGKPGVSCQESGTVIPAKQQVDSINAATGNSKPTDSKVS